MAHMDPKIKGPYPILSTFARMEASLRLGLGDF